MEIQNYFVKMLMFLIDGNNFILLYGFCSPTAQQPYPWKQRKIPKMRQSVWTAILSEKEAIDFSTALTQPGSISLGGKSFISPELLKRPMALSNDGQAATDGPIPEYRQILEFWNIHKREAFQKIQETFGTDGKELHQSIQELFIWAQEESGIDFFKNGCRFGNFEFYKISVYADGFEIETHKEYGLTKTTIKKTRQFHNNFLVNCIADCRGRSTTNQTKLFSTKENCLDFFSEEPMSRIIIQIWKEKSGELVFSKDISLIMGVSINMNFGSTPHRIRDPWSEKLFAAAANRSNIIKQQIETVSRTTPDRTITIQSSTYNAIDAAIDEGNNLFRGYRYSRSRGAFIPNQQKDGEINSFLKILEYIAPNSVKKVTIADPYFSVPSASKLLTRIPRSDIQIDIITSLEKKDPDTGEESDVCDDYRKFLRSKSAVLHNNLFVCNLSRGSRPVFHDRYLIRYFDNGKIDGFLLSNSLNSMGQFYPFVIAPMEQDVCLEVCDYVTWMCDSKAQSKCPKSERIFCDILYDSNIKSAPATKLLSEHIPTDALLGPWYNDNAKLSIPPKDLGTVASTIFEHWITDEQPMCKTLCSLGSITYPWSARDLADSIGAIEDATRKFTDVFIPLAKAREKEQNHIIKGINSPVYTLWALLNGQAKPSRQGFSLLFEQAGHIYYSGDNWLHGGYNLLLWLNPSAYVKLIEDIKSPLMFDTLALRMLCYSWSSELYYSILGSNSFCLQLLCSEWIFNQMKLGKLSNKQIQIILLKLTPEKRILQSVYLISRIVFHIRTSRLSELNLKLGETLRTWLLDLIADDITQCTSDIQETSIYWLYDCEDVSYCKLHLHLAKAVSMRTIRNRLLDEAIKIAGHSLLDCSYDRDVSELASLYVQGVDIRHSQNAENQILGKIVDWNIFEIATEPELKNYAHKKWYSAYVRAKRQMIILHTYRQRHPEADKTSQWINRWEDRLRKS